MSFRIGHGFDIHQLVEGRPLILGGVIIPYDRGLLGHSDADVLLHAITDAVLGAAGKPDIGNLFPNTDAAWKGSASTELLRRAWAVVRDDGWSLVNVDSSLVAEAPKLAPFIPEMKRIIGEVLGVESSCIGIKATTNEKLGALGRGEGIAAMAVALLSRA